MSSRASAPRIPISSGSSLRNSRDTRSGCHQSTSFITRSTTTTATSSSGPLISSIPQPSLAQMVISATSSRVTRSAITAETRIACPRLSVVIPALLRLGSTRAAEVVASSGA